MQSKRASLKKTLDKVVGVWYFSRVEVLLGLVILRFISTGLTDV